LREGGEERGKGEEFGFSKRKERLTLNVRDWYNFLVVLFLLVLSVQYRLGVVLDVVN